MMAEACNVHLKVKMRRKVKCQSTTAISLQVGDPEVQFQQRKICVISEMFHTSSLYHDDVIDRALTRRGKVSVNSRWNQKCSVFAGDFILGISSANLARTNNPEAGNDDSLTAQVTVVLGD